MHLAFMRYDFSGKLNPFLRQDLYITADTHFGDPSISAFADRPWNSMKVGIDAMNYSMLDEIDALPHGSFLLHLGDFAGIPLRQNQTQISEWVHLIKQGGKSLGLVVGNHDMLETETETYMFWHDVGFDCVSTESLVVDVPKTIGKYARKVIYSHCPVDQLYRDSTTFNIHGHTHQYDALHGYQAFCRISSKYKPIDQLSDNRHYFCACVEHNKYRPIRNQAIMAIIYGRSLVLAGQEIPDDLTEELLQLEKDDLAYESRLCLADCCLKKQPEPYYHNPLEFDC